MKVYGTVSDATKEKPLEGAKVGLYIGEKELTPPLYSDKDGRFGHEKDKQFIGETLTCRVEKEGFESKELTYKIEKEEVKIEIELVEEKIVLEIQVKDEEKNPLEGVEITLQEDGEQVGIGLSDKNGIYKITLGSDLEDKTINYKAELGGFELATSDILLKKETSQEITMKRISISPKPQKPSLPVSLPPKKWPKIATGIAAVIVAAIVVYFIIPPKQLKIDSFNAEPDSINKGESSTLTWKTKNTKEVEVIDNKGVSIGKFLPSGNTKVSPPETTTYILIARNEEGKEAKKKKQVEVGILLPKIDSFNAEPGSINKGASSTLTWKTKNTKEVEVIDNKGVSIGKFLPSGNTEVKPKMDTTYTLIAKNEEGKIADSEITIQVVIPTNKQVCKKWCDQNPECVRCDTKIGCGAGYKRIKSFTGPGRNWHACRKEVSVGKPDIFVSEFELQPQVPTQGRSVSVRVGVYNKGNKGSGPFTVQWWAGENFPKPACTWRVKSLVPKGGKILKCSYKGYRSWYAKIRTKVVIDPKGEVKEKDKKNNEKTVEIRVRKQ